MKGKGKTKLIVIEEVKFVLSISLFFPHFRIGLKMNMHALCHLLQSFIAFFMEKYYKKNVGFYYKLKGEKSMVEPGKNIT